MEQSLQDRSTSAHSEEEAGWEEVLYLGGNGGLDGKGKQETSNSRFYRIIRQNRNKIGTMAGRFLSEWLMRYCYFSWKRAGVGRKKFVPETLHLKCLTRAAQGEAEEAGGAEETHVSTQVGLKRRV